MTNTTLRAYLDELDRLLGQEALEEVIGHCRHILQHFPKNIATYRVLGQALLERGRMAEANDVMQRILAAVPDDFIAHICLSEANKDSNPTAAVWHLERAFEQEPDNGSLQEELKRLYSARDGNAPERLQLTSGALARLYLKGQLFAEATGELQRALEAAPDRVDLELLLARTYWDSEHPIEAAETARKALAILPYSLEANRILALLWIMSGRPSDAEPHVSILEQLDPFLAWDVVHPDGQGLPEDAFQLERLNWNAKAAAAMVTDMPDWVSTIGDVLDAPETYAMPETPAEPAVPRKTSGLLQRKTDQLKQGANAGADVPDWFTDMDGMDSGGASFQMPDWAQQDQLAESVAPSGLRPLPPADVPDWLVDVVQSAPPPEPAVDALGWLQTGPLPGSTPLNMPPPPGQAAQPSASQQASPPPEQFSEFDDLSWLDNSATSAASQPAQPAQSPLVQDEAADALSWLQTGPLPSLEEAQPATPAEPADIPAWLQTGPLSASPAPSAELESLNLDEWMAETPPAAAPSPSADLESLDFDAWLTETPAIPANRQPALGLPALEDAEDTGDGVDALDALAGNIPAWLQTGPLPSLEEAQPATPAPSIEPEALNFDDWLAETTATPTESETRSELSDFTALTEETMFEDAVPGEVPAWMQASAPTFAEPETPTESASESILESLDFLPEVPEPEIDYDPILGPRHAVETAQQPTKATMEDRAANEGVISRLPFQAEPPPPPPPPPDLDEDVAWLKSDEMTIDREALDLPPLSAAEPPEPEVASPVASVETGEDPLAWLKASQPDDDLSWLLGGQTNEPASGTTPAEPVVSSAFGSFDPTDVPIMPTSAPNEDGEFWLEEAQNVLPDESAELPVEPTAEDPLAWMRQFGLTPAQSVPAPEPDTPTLEGADLDEFEALKASLDVSETPAPVETGQPEAAAPGLTSTDVLAWLQNTAPITQMPEPEAATEIEMPGPATIQEPELEDEWLAAFDIAAETSAEGVPDRFQTFDSIGRETEPQAALSDEVAEMPDITLDWLNTAGESAEVAPAIESSFDWTTDNTPLATPDDVQAAHEFGPEGIGTPATRGENVPSWMNELEPLATTQDLPNWLDSAPAPAEPETAEEEDLFANLPMRIPEKPAPTRPNVETGVLEPDAAPDWLNAFGDEAAPPTPSTPVPAEADEVDWLGSGALEFEDLPAQPAAESQAPGMALEGFDVLETDDAEAPDWLANIGVAGSKPTPATTPAQEFDFADLMERDAEPAADMPGTEAIEAGETPAWLSQMAPRTAPERDPLAELDFGDLFGEATPAASELPSAAEGPTEPAEPEGQRDSVAQWANLVNTTQGTQQSTESPERPPANREPGAGFTFDKPPAWKRKKQS